jgi:Flp pilus assembly secretin CpaC
LQLTWFADCTTLLAIHFHSTEGATMRALLLCCVVASAICSVQAEEPAKSVPDGRRVKLYFQSIELPRTKFKALGIDVASDPATSDGKKSPQPSAPIDSTKPSMMESNAKFLQDMERWKLQGLVKRLAEFSLAVPSGVTAQFHAGGQIEYPAPPTPEEIAAQREPAHKAHEPLGTTVDFYPALKQDGTIDFELQFQYTEVDPALSVTIEGVRMPGSRRWIVRLPGFHRLTLSAGGTDFKPGQTLVVRGMVEPRVERVAQTIRRRRLGRQRRAVMVDRVNEIETVLLARVELEDDQAEEK